MACGDLDCQECPECVEIRARARSVVQPVVRAWHPSSEAPDSDRTVLIHCIGEEYDRDPLHLWLGYWIDFDWFTADGMVIDEGDVTHWMDLPEHPAGI